MWLDGRGLARQFKTTTVNSVLETTRSTRTEIRYNVAVAAQEWNLPATLTVIDPSMELREKFGLKGALFVQEVAGQTLAVHGCVRDAEGNLLVTCSTRLTAASQKRAGVGCGPFQYGVAARGFGWRKFCGFDCPNCFAAIAGGSRSLLCHSGNGGRCFAGDFYADRRPHADP